MSESVFYSRWWISIFPLLLLLLVIQLLPQAVSTQNSKNPSGSPEMQNLSGAAQTTAVPDNVVYGIFFRQIAAFNAKADEVERQGGDGRSLRRHFARIAGLNDAESELLDRIAADYIREVGIIEARQRAMVDAFHIRYPGGQMPHGEPRERPAAYHELNLERDQLYLRMRDQLQTVLGAETFVRLDTAMRSKIAGNPQSILGAPAPVTTPATEQEKP